MIAMEDPLSLFSLQIQPTQGPACPLRAVPRSDTQLAQVYMLRKSNALHTEDPALKGIAIKFLKKKTL